MAAIKTPNYTPEQTASIVEQYANGVTVEAIAMTIGKSVRSVVAKLSREGAYQKKERTTKNGDTIVKKDAVADEIAMLVGLTEADASSLAKANKTALASILAVIKTVKISNANDIS